MFYRNYLEVDRAVEKYNDIGCFTHEQLKEIRKGIEAGINVNEYANDSIPADEMFNKRWELIFKSIIN